MIFLPKSLAARTDWVTRNLRRIQFAMQEEQVYAERGQDYRTSIHQTYFVFDPLFSKPILTRQNIASTKTQFLASQVSVLRRNKANNSSTSNRPFFSCTESHIVLGNLFKLFRIDTTFALEVCRLGIKIKKIWQSSYTFHYPQWQTFFTNVMANLTSLDKLLNTWAFVAAEIGSVELLELVALFLLKTGTFGTKNW